MTTPTNKSHDALTAILLPSQVDRENWVANSGLELEGLLGREFGDRPQVRGMVKASATSILSRCVNPKGTPVSNTGLIVGYVQSGKTLSFTSVAAAAHDNGFRLVIVLAGTTNILARQSRDRLLQDLHVRGGALRPWRHFHNASIANRDAIARLMEAWTAKDGRKQTVLITVLKHSKRINDVAILLRALPSELLGAALVIDDEADQASLNNRVRQGKRSPVYQSVLNLRDALPLHTCLQYTATPQANIFIPMIDLLSPDFCEVLEPGAGYVGGRTVFRDHGPELVQIIPYDEFDDGHGNVEPPSSLLSAMRYFLLGVAAGLIDAKTTYELNPENRSMMVHPSRLVNDHTIYAGWVQSTLSAWLPLLDDKDDADHQSLSDEFKDEYQALKATVGDALPTFSALSNELANAIRETAVQQVNRSDEVASWDDEWRQHYSWILVGGQKLDRGFTVEGLTVTYMPRGPGVGYADTIQQRGRFFGYKRSYLGFCRIFVEPDVHNAFDIYVESEESMRSFLKRNAAPGDLKSPDLKRRFQMDRSLQPTRRSVLLDVPTHIDFGSGWFTQSRPHTDVAVSAANAEKIRRFASLNDLQRRVANERVPWLPTPQEARVTHIHEMATDILVPVLYNELLAELVMADDEDQEGWQIALALIERVISSDPDASGSIIWIRPQATTHRGTTTKGAISALSQGAYPVAKARRGDVYKGDSAVHLGRITLQVHTLQIHDGPASKSATPKWPDVTVLRLWLDDDIRDTFITQLAN